MHRKQSEQELYETGQPPRFCGEITWAREGSTASSNIPRVASGSILGITNQVSDLIVNGSTEPNVPELEGLLN